MRYSIGFMFVLAGLVTLPLSVSAQAGEENATAEPNLQEPSSEPAPQEPALQLKLDDAGVEVVRTAPPTVDGYPRRIQITDEPDLRVRRARIGLGVSAFPFVLGAIMFGSSYACWSLQTPGTPCEAPQPYRPLFVPGLTLMVGGAAGMITSGIVLGVRKRKLRRLQEAQYGTPRRVQWDVARSRVVF